MFTSIGFIVFSFSAVMILLSLSALTMSSVWRPLRAPAARMLVVFSVAALSGSYVWLQAGPDADYRLSAQHQVPSAHLYPPQEMNI